MKDDPHQSILIYRFASTSGAQTKTKKKNFWLFLKSQKKVDTVTAPITRDEPHSPMHQDDAAAYIPYICINFILVQFSNVWTEVEKFYILFTNRDTVSSPLRRRELVLR